MNFRFKQSLKMLAVAGAISGLVACGGGGDDAPAPAKVTQDLSAVTVGTQTQATAKQYAALLVNKTASLPNGAIFTEPGAPAVAASTKFTFAPLPASAPANAISGFQLDAAQGTFSGYIAAGSTVICGNGKWGNTTYPVLPVTGTDPNRVDSVGNKVNAAGDVCFTINGTMTLDPQTGGLANGPQGNIDVAVVITAAGQTVPTIVPSAVALTVTINQDGTATISGPAGSGISFTAATVTPTGSVGG